MSHCAWQKWSIAQTPVAQSTPEHAGSRRAFQQGAVAPLGKRFCPPGFGSSLKGTLQKASLKHICQFTPHSLALA